MARTKDAIWNSIDTDICRTSPLYKNKSSTSIYLLHPKIIMINSRAPNINRRSFQNSTQPAEQTINASRPQLAILRDPSLPHVPLRPTRNVLLRNQRIPPSPPLPLSCIVSPLNVLLYRSSAGPPSVPASHTASTTKRP